MRFGSFSSISLRPEQHPTAHQSTRPACDRCPERPRRMQNESVIHFVAVGWVWQCLLLNDSHMFHKQTLVKTLCSCVAVLLKSTITQVGRRGSTDGQGGPVIAPMSWMYTSTSVNDRLLPSSRHRLESHQLSRRKAPLRSLEDHTQ